MKKLAIIINTYFNAFTVFLSVVLSIFLPGASGFTSIFGLGTKCPKEERKV